MRTTNSLLNLLRPRSFQEKVELEARLLEADRQMKEDEQRIRQEMKEANEAQLKSQQEHFDKLFAETQRCGLANFIKMQERHEFECFG